MDILFIFFVMQIDTVHRPDAIPFALTPSCSPVFVVSPILVHALGCCAYCKLFLVFLSRIDLYIFESVYSTITLVFYNHIHTFAAKPPLICYQQSFPSNSRLYAIYDGDKHSIQLNSLFRRAKRMYTRAPFLAPLSGL